jgi:hypothetical protein
MPHISQIIPSKYLKQADFDQDYIVTIERTRSPQRRDGGQAQGK